MNVEPRWGRVLRLGAKLLALFGLAFVLATVTPIDVWWARGLQGRAYSPTGEVLIVLSGSMFEDGSMGWSSFLRALYAGRNYRAGGFKQIVVAGGPGPRSQVPAALAMAEFLRCHGIPADAIHVEATSSSTRENALFAQPLISRLPGRKVLLTSDYHMFRARRVFAKLGMDVLPQPVPDVRKRYGSWSQRWPAFLDLTTETCKIVYYRLRGWI